MYLATFTNSQNKTFVKQGLTLLPKITSLRIKLVKCKDSKRFLDCKFSWTSFQFILFEKKKKKKKTSHVDLPLPISVRIFKVTFRNMGTFRNCKLEGTTALVCTFHIKHNELGNPSIKREQKKICVVMGYFSAYLANKSAEQLCLKYVTKGNPVENT